MKKKDTRFTIFPVVILDPPRQEFSFLKMFFQQERMPDELYIEIKAMTIKNVKELAEHYIKTYDYFLRQDNTLLIQKRSAQNALYWLELLYREVINKRMN